MAKHTGKRKLQPRLNEIFPELTPARKILATLDNIPPDVLRDYAKKHPKHWRDVIETLIHLSAQT